MDNHGDRTRITVDVQLPCGCWVQRGLATPRGLEDLAYTLKFSADLLPHHFDRVEVAHKCDLVTETNPNGDSRSN